MQALSLRRSTGPAGRWLCPLPCPSAVSLGAAWEGNRGDRGAADSLSQAHPGHAEGGVGPVLPWAGPGWGQGWPSQAWKGWTCPHRPRTCQLGSLGWTLVDRERLTMLERTQNPSGRQRGRQGPAAGLDPRWTGLNPIALLLACGYRPGTTLSREVG